MMTSSNGNIFRVTGHLCGEFTSPVNGEVPAQRPVTRSFGISLICAWRKVEKTMYGWWFETPSRSLWRHSYACDWIVAWGAGQPELAVNSWFAERTDFTMIPLSCKEGRQCGHYTQVSYSIYYIGNFVTLTNFRQWMHWKLPFWQRPEQPLMTILVSTI